MEAASEQPPWGVPAPAPGETPPTEASPGPVKLPDDPTPARGEPGGEDPFARRPELFVGGAFAGGLALAGLLRWIGSR